MGLGILGARRLMDYFKIESVVGKGTIVEVGHDLPERAAPVTRTKLAEVSATLQLLAQRDTWMQVAERSDGCEQDAIPLRHIA